MVRDVFLFDPEQDRRQLREIEEIRFTESGNGRAIRARGCLNETQSSKNLQIQLNTSRQKKFPFFLKKKGNFL